MDGVRRLLRSLEGLFPAFAEPRAAFAGGAAYAGAPYRAAPAKDRRNARPRVDWTGRLVRIARLPGLGLGLTLTFFACVGLFGAVQGGGYESFVKENGRPRDIAARMVGFGVEAVTIAGAGAGAGAGAAAGGAATGGVSGAGSAEATIVDSGVPSSVAILPSVRSEAASCRSSEPSSGALL